MKFYSCLLLLSFLNMAVMAQDLMPGDAKDAKEALMLENAANMPLDALPNVFEGNIGVAVADIVGIDPQADRSIPASVPKNKIGNGGKPCIEESVTYPDGASTKFVGLQCLNGTHYDAVDFICADGAIRDIDTVRACPVFDAPYCVQCGGRSFGAALCLSKPDVPDYCDTFLPAAASAVLKAGNSTPNVLEGNIGVAVAKIVGNDPQADPSIPASVPKNKIGNGGKPCIEESATYPDGASTKFVGLQCLNGTHYDAVDFICADGAIRDIDTVRACPVFDAPYCVQCGGRSFGAALCLSKPDVPDYCDTFLPVAASAVLKAGNSTGTGKMMMMMKKNGLGATNTTTTRALQQEASVPARRFRGSSR